MAANQSQWPEQLKKFVNKTFAQCTDNNRPTVEAELKKVIYDAYQTNSLWETNWDEVKLASLQPAGGVKRKYDAGMSAATGTYAYTAAAANQEASKRDKRMKRFNLSNNAASSEAGGNLASRLESTSLGNGVAAGASSWKSRTASYVQSSSSHDADPSVIDWDKETIVGRSTKLEKPYLRLTSVPDPDVVRPLHILRQAFEMVKRRWRESNGEDYAWVCDQFKSIRQDLVVQRIKSEFTVLVYEFHARTALEKGDLGEFNQCQTMLRDLYKLGLGQSANRLEFLGYRILYFLFSKNATEISNLLPTLTDEERLYEGVRHALLVRSALATSNYVRFFKLWTNAPKMGGYLMDHFLDRERISALVVISKSYRTIAVTYVADQLGFENPDSLHEFLAQYNAAFYVVPAAEASGTKGAAPTNPLRVPLERRHLDCRQAQAPVAQALRSMTKIDIKGQL